MADIASVWAPYSGEQLLGLTEEFRFRIFRAILLLAVVLVPLAVALILVVGKDPATRLGLLGVAGCGSVLAMWRARWCYGCLDRQQWLSLVPAACGTAVLVAGGARQDAIFLVLGAMAIGISTVIEIKAAMAVGGIIAFGYLLSIATRGEALLLGGSAGDLAAVVSLLAAIYAANRTVEIVMMGVADLNIAAEEVCDPSLGSVEEIVAQEATDQIPEGARERLSQMGITGAEMRVVYLAGEGFLTKKIAKRLGKSTSTIETQLESIKRKLDVDTSPELTAKICMLLAGRTPD